MGVCRLVGDIIILQPDNPNLKFVIPDAGGMTSVDTMVIPTGGDVYTASTFMNFFYDPEIAAKVTAYVNYITPVKGTKEAITKIDPAFMRPAHLPDARGAGEATASSTPKRSKPRVSGEVAGRDRRAAAAGLRACRFSTATAG